MIVVYIMIIIGLFFSLMSILGLLRFPDLYTRLHASTKGTTFGAIFVILAVVISSIINYDSTSITLIIHSLLALILIILTNPVGAHAIARGAHRSGIKPYGAVIDELYTKNKNDEEKK